MATNEQQASNDWGIADTISLLAPHLPDDLKLQALNIAHKLSDPGARSSALTSLSGVTAETDALIIKEDALTIAQSIENQWLKAQALAEVASAFPNERKREILVEALACVEKIPAEWHRKRVLTLLANSLPDDLSDQAILLAHQFQNVQLRIQTLSKFAHRLPEQERILLMKDVPLIEEEYSRAVVLVSLMKFLHNESKSDFLKYASELEEAGPRSQVFNALAQYFPDHQVEFQEETIKMARSIIEPYGRFWALFDVIPSLPDSVRGKLTEETFDTIRMIEDEQWRATALFYLATILLEEKRPTVIQEAFDTARQVEDINRRVMALLTLMEALPDDLRPDIIHESMKAITERVEL